MSIGQKIITCVIYSNVLVGTGRQSKHTNDEVTVPRAMMNLSM